MFYVSYNFVISRVSDLLTPYPLIDTFEICFSCIFLRIYDNLLHYIILNFLPGEFLTAAVSTAPCYTCTLMKDAQHPVTSRADTNK